MSKFKVFHTAMQTVRLSHEQRRPSRLPKELFLLSLPHFQTVIQKTIPNTPWSARLLYLDPDQLNELSSQLTNAVQQAPIAIPLFALHRPMPAILSGLSLLQDSTLNL